MTTTAEQPLSDSPAVERGKHLPALDGVRALAVAGVVTYHVGADWLPGGFLGVDLFFVLSGFLITGILLGQIDRTGRIGFGEFFTRRARRLLPALYLMLVAVCAWSFFVAAPDEIGDLRGAALAALFYVANWFFILTGQSYFADMLGPSPVEHTWSLAIEEQYYLVWPLLLLLLVRKASPRWIVAVIAALILASVVLMAVTYDAGDPSVAYFGTFTRIHELLVGALLAWLAHRGLTLPARGQWTGWVALVGVLAMMATVSDVSSFYYRGGSLLFCAVVAWLLLSLGTGTAGRGPAGLFALKPLVWIGLISYGIYLWHWPLILWLTPVRTGLDGLALAALRIGLTVTVAAASYYVVERPIRRGTVGSFALTPRRMAVIVPVAMALMAALIIGSTARAVAPAVDLDETVAPTTITGATSADAPVAAFAGDSIPKELMPALEAEAATRGWGVIPLAFGGCSITGLYQLDLDGERFNWSKRCSEGFAQMQSKAVSDFDPDVVVWYSNRERFPVRVGDEVLTPGTPEHTAALDNSLEAAYKRFTAGGARIVIVLPVPKAPPVVGTCASGVSTAPECATDEAYYASFADLTASFERLAAAHPDDISLVRIDDLLCPGGRDCPLIEKGGQAVRPDGIHFSDPGAAWFVPLIFDRAGLAPVGSSGA